MLESVLTVHDYYDGPVLGLAQFEGAPHIYARLFDSAAEEWTDAYQLQPIAPDDLTLVLEDWSIWCRFFAAWRSGRLSMEEPYALPEDSERRTAIHPRVQQILARPCTAPLIRVAEFLGSGARHEERPLQVVWHLPPDPIPTSWHVTA